MFNVTVLKMKDIIKYLVGIVITILIVIFATRYFSLLRKDKMQSKMKIFSSNNFTQCLDKVIPTISNIEEQNNEKKKEILINNNYLENPIKMEIASIDELEKEENAQQNISNEGNNEKSEEIDTTDKNIVSEQTENLKTEVITSNPISESYNVQYKNVKIKNQTTYNLTEEMMQPNIEINSKNIIVFHTHTCESYTPSEKYQYSTKGNYRTTDLNFTVAKVGTEFESYLKNFNINIFHDTTYHDYPSYTGSYTRSLQTVENILKTNSSDIIIDLHRDAVGNRSDYAPIVKIGEDVAAQIMFVIGTNEGGLYHPNWNQNLKFAIKIQEIAETKYPGLFKPIMLTKSRYNQHIGKYANIIEVGATGNTLEQCLTSMKYLSVVFNEALNN